MSRKVVGALGAVVLVLVAIIGARLLLSATSGQGGKPGRASEVETLRASVRTTCVKAQAVVAGVKRALVSGSSDGVDAAQSLLVYGLPWIDLCTERGSGAFNALETDPARMLQILESLEQQLSAAVEASDR